MSLRHCQISLRRSRLEALCATLSGLNIRELSLHPADPAALSADRPESLIRIECAYPADREKRVIDAIVASGRTPVPGNLRIRFLTTESPASSAPSVAGHVTLSA